MSGLDAFGTTFDRGDGGGPEVFTSIAKVTNISGPSLARDTYDVTDHASPGQWEEVIGGIVRSGEVTLDLNYDPSVHDTLLADFADKTARNYRLNFPTTPVATWNVQAVLTGFEPAAPHDDKLSATATFKLSGQPTFS